MKTMLLPYLIRSKQLALIWFALFFGQAFGQKANDTVHVYFIPGQGSDHRLFDSIKLSGTYAFHYLDYGTPKRKATMAEFARELIPRIDTTQSCVLIGVSMGGMLVSELSSLIPVKKAIIISSAKNRQDLPFRYRFQRYLPLYAVFPGCILNAGAKIMQPLVEPDRRKNKSTFKKMLKAKNGRYMKRTIRLICRWDKTTPSKNLIHIHGSNDHTLPLRCIKSKVDYIVTHGSHMMTLTRASELNQVLAELLP